MAWGWLPLGQAGASPWHSWASCAALYHCDCCCCCYCCDWYCDVDDGVWLSGFPTFKVIWRFFSSLPQQHLNVRKLEVQDSCLELGHKSLQEHVQVKDGLGSCWMVVMGRPKAGVTTLTLPGGTCSWSQLSPKAEGKKPLIQSRRSSKARA